jgi:hypothetical protein
MRYTGDGQGLQTATTKVFEFIGAESVANAIQVHRDFGNAKWQRNDHLRSIFELRYCKSCGKHWLKFSVEKLSGNDWKEISELSVTGFTQEVVSL